MKPCLACDDGATDQDVIIHSVNTCDVWKSLSNQQRLAKVKCKKHPFAKDHVTKDCKMEIRQCKNCKEKSHHILLCPKTRTIGNSTQTKSLVGTSSSDPILMQTTFVTTLHRCKLSTYWDLGSSDNYITKKMAKKLGLKGSEREIEVEGIGRQKHIEVTTLYDLLIVYNDGCQHEVHS